MAQGNPHDKRGDSHTTTTQQTLDPRHAVYTTPSALPMDATRGQAAATISSYGLLSPPDSNSSETPMKSDEGPSRREEAPSKREATGGYLENLSQQILEVSLNLKDPSHPLLVKHLSPTFRGKHDTLPKWSSRDDHQDGLKKHLEKQPNVHVIVLNHSSEVDDSRGRATVYLWYELSGLEHGLGREAVALFSWERKQGNWMIIKHSGMRGPAGFC